MREWLVKLIFAIFVIVMGVLLFLSIFGLVWLPYGCNENNLCENKFSHARRLYKDRAEQTSFPCALRDCCYAQERALSECQENWDAYGQEQGWTAAEISAKIAEECSAERLTRENPAAWFDCVESIQVCNNETCAQNCDHDYICEEGEEGKFCEDCW
jgi:hypothetical protein